MAEETLHHTASAARRDAERRRQSVSQPASTPGARLVRRGFQLRHSTLLVRPTESGTHAVRLAGNARAEQSPPRASELIANVSWCFVIVSRFKLFRRCI